MSRSSPVRSSPGRAESVVDLASSGTNREPSSVSLSTVEPVGIPRSELRSIAMQCPYCGEDDDKVVDSRPADSGLAIRRRRECIQCDARFTTYERVEGAPLVVRKRSGGLEPFRADKLANGIRLAVGNGPAADAVDALVRSIEQDMNAIGSPISSDQLGLAVLDRLRALDAAAYLRFASVYKGFLEPEDFAREIRALEDQQIRTTDGQ